jgi:hypothetical protein
MKREIALDIISCLFILLFTYTGFMKLLTHESFVYTLSRSPLIKEYAPFISLLLPIVELGVTFILSIRHTRRFGLYISFILMLIFTFYIAYMLYFTPDRPCSCGGVLKSMTWPQHLIFNITFTILALIAIRISKNKPHILIQKKEVSFH